MVDLFFVNLSNDSSVTPMTEVGVTKQDETREKRVEELPESWRKEREREGEREREAHRRQRRWKNQTNYFVRVAFTEMGSRLLFSPSIISAG